MPLAIASPSPALDPAELRERRFRRGSVHDRGRRLRIGFLNNMPDAAWQATERQFARLLEEAADDFEIELSLWTLETLERSFEARRAMGGYRAARELRGAARDALIVTGAEPRAADLREEPYWRELTAVFDWSRARTVSTLLSCLAAHAAVLHHDGIVRRRLAEKCCGLFATRIVARHELVEGLPAGPTPHSRWNGLDEGELAAKGYLTLTRSAGAGVDMFVKEGSSLELFLQGHPEYDCDTLAREYRRDLLRHLRGEAHERPRLPKDYFAPALAERLAALDDPATPFPAEALAMSAPPWRAGRVRLFRNWLEIVARRKAARHAPSLAVRWGG